MAKPPLVIGLTGGIGSGKSEVGRRFEARGATLVDADQIAHQVVEPGTDALERIATHFGPGVLDAQGRLDRPALRAIIFSHPEEKQWLESLLHPLINARIAVQLAEAPPPYVLLVSPLLLETGQDKLVDRVLVVDTPEEEQLTRASRRDRSDRAQIERIMASQMPRRERLERAQDIIENHGDLADLDAQVAALHRRYTQTE